MRALLNRRGSWIMGPVALLLAAGCGSTGSPAPVNSAVAGDAGVTASPSPTPVHACRILTRAVAQRILGVPVDSHDTPTTIPYPNCVYTSSSGSAFMTVSLTVYPSLPPAANLLTEFRQQYQGLSDLAGVGDSALQESDGRLVVAIKGTMGCVMLRTGEIGKTSAAASTKAMAAICAQAFAG